MCPEHHHVWVAKPNKDGLQMASNKTLRDNLGQMWPTDPRHSWWRRNRCCGSPGDCRAWTPGCESEALILPSETSCPPSHAKGGRHHSARYEGEKEERKSRWDWQGGNERSSTSHQQVQWCIAPVTVAQVCSTIQLMVCSYCSTHWYQQWCTKKCLKEKQYK